MALWSAPGSMSLYLIPLAGFLAPGGLPLSLSISGLLILPLSPALGHLVSFFVPLPAPPTYLLAPWSVPLSMVYFLAWLPAPQSFDLLLCL